MLGQRLEDTLDAKLTINITTDSPQWSPCRGLCAEATYAHPDLLKLRAALRISTQVPDIIEVEHCWLEARAILKEIYEQQRTTDLVGLMDFRIEPEDKVHVIVAFQLINQDFLIDDVIIHFAKGGHARARGQGSTSVLVRAASLIRWRDCKCGGCSPKKNWKSLTQQHYGPRWDGTIVEIYDNDVHVRLTGTRQIKRNVQVADYIDRDKLRINMRVRLLSDDSGHPYLSAYFPTL